MQNNWHIVYTRPLQERKVVEILTRKKIENFCPLKQQDTKKRMRRKLIAEPLFPSYVFVRVSEKDLLDLKTIPEVINIVYWKNKPATIYDEEITMIKTFLKEYSDVRVEKGIVSLSEHAAIEKEPLMEREGNVITVSDKTIRAYLPSLGYYVHAEVGKVKIELIGEPIRVKEKFNFRLNF